MRSTARHAVDRASMAAWLRRWFLLGWFMVWGLQSLTFLIAHPGSFGFDVRLYQLAGHAWLTGNDPWDPLLSMSARSAPLAYAGPPVTLLPFILLDWVPADVLVVAVVATAAVSMLWVLRRLRLPLWWMLFPPIIEGIWVGNLNIYVIALLVRGGLVAGAIAVLLKAYALLPLMVLRRWQAVAVAAVVVLVTAPFLPWLAFVEQFASITSALAIQSWGGRSNVLTSPMATAGGLIALILLGRERAAWLAVPVLWPSTQLHYTVLALPALSPFLAIPASITAPGFLTAGVIALALWEHRMTAKAILNPWGRTGYFTLRPPRGSPET